MEQVKLPKPTRGIIAQIARETGVTINAILKRYQKADPIIVLKVATLEQDLLQQRIDAINQFARSIAMQSAVRADTLTHVAQTMESQHETATVA